MVVLMRASVFFTSMLYCFSGHGLVLKVFKFDIISCCHTSLTWMVDLEGLANLVKELLSFSTD